MNPGLPLGSWTTSSAAATQELGGRLAAALGPGSVVALYGDLGSGKTCLIQGVCAALGVVAPVTSPTFILVNEYAGASDGRHLPVYHFDLYRIQELDELEDLGVDEYLYGQGVCLIEWADRAGGSLPEERCDVCLEYVAPSVRRIVISQHSTPAANTSQAGAEADEGGDRHPE